MDTIQITVLKDGRVKVETDTISQDNHVSAERFLQMMEELLGGESETEEKRTHHEHTHEVRRKEWA